MQTTHGASGRFGASRFGRRLPSSAIEGNEIMDFEASPTDKDVRRSFKSIEVPPMKDIPGMIKREEGQYLYWLTSEIYTGQGAIVEIGTWLGKSTSYLAAGLTTHRQPNTLICYDRYEWNGGATWVNKSGATVDRPAGDDFRPDFLANVAEFTDMIEARKSSIQDIKFELEQIEVLFLDAPIMAPEIVAFQSPIHVVSDGTLVGVRVDKVWEQQDITSAASAFKSWTVDESFAAWEKWREIVPSAAWPSFQSGLAMLLETNGYIDEAQALLRTVIDDMLCFGRWNKWQNTATARRHPALFGPEFLERQVQ